jgi:phosphoribosyl-AMP cyclohydrolase
VSTSASTVVGTPLDVDEDALAAVDFGAQGLIPAVVQDVEDLTVLMVGYMDPEALRRTLATGRTWFWSRSRREYWQKGETSGDRQFVREVRVDCDGDTVVVLVDQHGRGACHTGERSCFYRTVGTAPVQPRPGCTGAGCTAPGCTGAACTGAGSTDRPWRRWAP